MNSLLHIDAATTGQFVKAAEAMRKAGSAVFPTIAQYAAPVVQPEWDKALRSRGDTHAERKFISETGASEIGVGRIVLRAGGTDSGPATVRSWEFGANRFLTRDHVNKSRKGLAYIVRARHTQRQFKRSTTEGYVFTPSIRSVHPRFMALVLQTTVRMIHEAMEGKVT